MLIVIALALLLIGLMLGLYAVKFGPSSHWTLSPNSGAWNDFGAFIGGVLAPALSLLGMLLVATTINLQLEERRDSMRSLFQAHFFQTLELHRQLSADASGVEAARRGHGLFSHALDMVSARAHGADIQSAYNEYRGKEGLPLVQPLWAGHALIQLALRAPIDDREFYQHLLDATLGDEELALLVYEARASTGHTMLLRNLQASHLWARAERAIQADFR